MIRIFRSFATAAKDSIKNNTQKDSNERRPFQVSLLQRVLSVRQVARVNSGGKIRSVSALVVVGDRNGSAGYGMGRGNDTMAAVNKATDQAKKNLKTYLRY
jgi:small subunit ribosomal protein S5